MLKYKENILESESLIINMKAKYFKKALSLLLLFITVFSLSLVTFASEAEGDLLFGYSTKVKEQSGDEILWGYILWGGLILAVVILIILAIINLIRLKKEEKASGKPLKPTLVIKKGYKN